jgi:hypothetical protein
MRAYVLSIQVLACALGLRAAAATEEAQPAPVVVTGNATAAAQPPTQPGFALKPVGIVRDVEKLTQSGADPAVVKAFVQSWTTPYSVTANDILQMHEAGVPSDVLTTLIRHGGELGAQASAYAPPQAMPPAGGLTAPPMAGYPESVPAAPSYAEPYPYNYGYPDSYSYPAYEPYYVPNYSYSYGFWPYYWPSYGFYGYYPFFNRGFFDHRGFDHRGFDHRGFDHRGFNGGRSFAGQNFAAGRSFAGRPVGAVGHSMGGRPFVGGGSFAGRSFAGGHPSFGGRSFAGGRPGGGFSGHGGGGRR